MRTKNIDREQLYLKEIQPLFDANYQLIPLKYPGTQGKDGKDVSKAPLHADWPKRKYSPSEIKAHFMKGGNVGVRPSEDDMVLDIDPRNFQSEDELQNFCKEAEIDLGLFPCVLTGGGGIHVYMKKPKLKE